MGVKRRLSCWGAGATAVVLHARALHAWPSPVHAIASEAAEAAEKVAAAVVVAPAGARAGSTVQGPAVSAQRLLDEVGAEEAEISCCAPPYTTRDCNTAYVDETTGTEWACESTASLYLTCGSCSVTSAVSEASCSSCCSSVVDECMDEKVEWLVYIALLVVLSMCCLCSVACAFTETRRRRKGMSFARSVALPSGEESSGGDQANSEACSFPVIAYSLPQGMPIVRATVASFRQGGRAGGGGRKDGQQADGDSTMEGGDAFADDDGSAPIPIAAMTDDDLGLTAVPYTPTALFCRAPRGQEGPSRLVLPGDSRASDVRGSRHPHYRLEQGQAPQVEVGSGTAAGEVRVTVASAGVPPNRSSGRGGGGGVGGDDDLSSSLLERDSLAER